MVRLPWFPVLAQYLQQQTPMTDTKRLRVPQLPPPLLDVLHTSKIGLQGESGSLPNPVIIASY